MWLVEWKCDHLFFLLLRKEKKPNPPTRVEKKKDAILGWLNRKTINGSVLSLYGSYNNRLYTERVQMHGKKKCVDVVSPSVVGLYMSL